MVSRKYLCAFLIYIAIFLRPYIPSRHFCICLRLRHFSVLEIIMVVFLALNLALKFASIAICMPRTNLECRETHFAHWRIARSISGS
jgi:hypothetical protein